MYVKLFFLCIFFVIEILFVLFLLFWLRRLSIGGFFLYEIYEGGGLS